MKSTKILSATALSLLLTLGACDAMMMDKDADHAMDKAEDAMTDMKDDTMSDIKDDVTDMMKDSM